MPLTVGILMIGSLYWDDDSNRVQWRKDRLDLKREYEVTVPIRYGRKSKKRNNTFTMVFSRLCLWPNHGLGIAKIIPCKNRIKKAEELIEEAECLWAVEKPNGLSGYLSANWGCVALLVNPDSQISSGILKKWKHRISKENRYGKLSNTKREGSIVTHNGLLNIPWPRTKNDKSQVPVDLLLATANDPSLRGNPPHYPRIVDIAHAWRDDSINADYFWSNRKSGIFTYQDDKIMQILRK